MTPYVEATAQLALADAIHDGSADCNANYYVAAAECRFRDIDIEQAAEMMEALLQGWMATRPRPSRNGGTRAVTYLTLLAAFAAGILLGVIAGIYSVYWQKPAAPVDREYGVVGFV